MALVIAVQCAQCLLVGAPGRAGISNGLVGAAQLKRRDREVRTRVSRGLQRESPTVARRKYASPLSGSAVSASLAAATAASTLRGAAIACDGPGS